MPSFPQLRRDPIVDRWVLITPDRARRPLELAELPQTRHVSPCPFCEGQERRTPNEVYAHRPAGTAPDSPGWQVRIVPNMFPATRVDVEAVVAAGFSPGYGVHEVVVESPRHAVSLSELNATEVRAVFAVIQERLRTLGCDDRLAYVQVFKNQGAGAGASVEHVHSQILGLPLVPREIAAELTGAADHWARCGRCAFCDLIERELRSGERVVAVNDRVVALAAFAGRFAYETWILPRRHGSHFETAALAEVHAATDVVHAILRRLGELIEKPSYNLILHTAPLHDGARADYHWHWELLPRTTGIAGFELATGWFLNALPPEVAAEKLRCG